ncbi:hypothetical protein FACS1894123_08780 [Bacteroidia bacterium]|nr:hypothetical protein FACS1894123_08780 [Bacteroidia bacterium]
MKYQIILATTDIIIPPIENPFQKDFLFSLVISIEAFVIWLSSFATKNRILIVRGGSGWVKKVY